MSLKFDFSMNEQSQREACAIIFGLSADVATKHPKKISDTVDFLLNGETIPFLEAMGQETQLQQLIDSLPNFQKRHLAGILSERFLKQGLKISPSLKTWCLQMAPDRVGRVLEKGQQLKHQ